MPKRAVLLNEATEEARVLLRTTVRTLRFARIENIWRWWGVLPPGKEGRLLRSFLDDSVEPSAAVLLAGALLETGTPYRFTNRRTPTREELQRMLEDPTALEPAELLAYAVDAAAKRDAAAHARFKWRPRRVVYTARPHYSFACFFSRVAALDREAQEPSLERSVAELGRFFAKEPRHDYRATLAAWARRDPSLKKVRRDPLTRDRFAELIESNSRARPPLTEEEEFEARRRDVRSTRPDRRSVKRKPSTSA